MTSLNPPFRLLGKKIIFSTLVQYVGKAFQFAFSAIAIKLISGFLTENDFGIYAVITEYVLFFSVVANLGIFAHIVKKMSTNPRDGRVFVHGMFLRLVTVMAAFVIGMGYLIGTGNEFSFVVAASLFFGTLLFDFLTSVCDGMLQANYMMGRATLALIIGKVFSLIGIVYVVHGASLHSVGGMKSIILIFLPLVLGSVVTFALSFYFVIQKIHLRWSISLVDVWSMFKAGLPFGIITIINSLYFRFLPDYFGHEILSQSQFATFNISFRIAQVMSLFSTFLMFSALPGMREYIAGRHWDKMKKLYSKILIILSLGGFFLVTLGSLVGPTLLTLLTHKKYFLPEFWYVLPLMLLLAAISYYYDVILITLFAFDQNRWLLLRECFALGCALFFFFSSFFLEGVHMKLIAILVAAIIGESVMVIAGCIKIRKLLRMSV